MKNVILSVVFIFCFSPFLSAQKLIIWKGGTPGMKNDWHCANNWSSCSVPDEFSNVFIPDVSCGSQAAPVLKKGSVEINALYLETAASLTIEQGAELVVLSEAYGLEQANVCVKGSLQLPGSGLEKKTAAIAMRQ